MADQELKTINRLSRGSSLFESNPQLQLLKALQKQEYEIFYRLLNSPNIDVEHVYEHPHYKTCLEIACSNKKLDTFVKVLVERTPNVNKLNKVHNKAPIHFAVEIGDIKILKELLNTKNIDINISCVGNNTAINWAIKQIRKNKERITDYEEIVKLLLEKGIDANIPDSKNDTPIHSAAAQGLETIVRLILDHSKIPIDLDTHKDLDNKTARDVLSENFGDRFNDVSKITEEKEITATILFSHLSNHAEENFINDFDKIYTENMKKILIEHNGLFTLLQNACDKGMDRIVRILLENGADPNLTACNDNKTPAALACYGGYYKILELLQSHESVCFKTVCGENSLLQIIIKQSKKNVTDENINYEKCRRILLSSEKSKSDINYVDFIGNSALHYATKNGDQETVKDLLRSGAYIGTRNKFGEPPLIDMSVSTLESYLDECITTNNEQPFDDKYEINFKYDFLVPPKMNIKPDSSKTPLMNEKTDDIEAILTPETDILLYMTKHPEFKTLLAHPVITSFLYLKWQRINCLFYANIGFYATFWFSLMLYIMYGYENYENEDTALKVIVHLSKYLIIIGMCILVSRELIQFIVSPKKYITSIVNWIEIALIVITFNITLNNHIGSNLKQQMCAIAILLSSAEFILLIGCFPRFSTNIEMLKTVSKNFFKFLLWYCILIIAFALSFYTLFRTNELNTKANNTQTNDDEDSDFFIDPGMSLFKTIIMLIGELDAGSIEFNKFPITSHIIFVTFVFVIPIVLFNLLNGLAVSDTQAIRSNAVLVGHISRVRLISYFEQIFLHSSHFKKNCCSFTRFNPINWFAKRICLFPYFLPTAQISVKVNQSNIIKFEEKGSRFRYQDPEAVLFCIKSCSNFKMNSIVVKTSKNVINGKLHKNENINKLEGRLDAVEKKIDQILYHLSKNN